MYIVMTAKSRMPASCKFGDYRKVAVVECADGMIPKQIHPRHKSVKRIVICYDRLNSGKTARCAYRTALAKANAMCEALNKLSENSKSDNPEEFHPAHSIPEDHYAI